MLGTKDEFGPALWRLAVEHNIPQAADLSVTADWIWNLAADYFPDSVQIVDWFHPVQSALDCVPRNTSQVPLKHFIRMKRGKRSNGTSRAVKRSIWVSFTTSPHRSRTPTWQSMPGTSTLINAGCSTRIFVNRVIQSVQVPSKAASSNSKRV